jgi:Cytochrome c3
MSTRKRRFIIFLLGVGITLILVGLTPLVIAFAQETTPEATTSADSTARPIITPTGDNGYCVICHNIPWRTVTLQDGNLMNLYVPPEALAGSVHGENGEQGALGCLDCHGEDAFPHDGPTPSNRREYRLQMVETCFGCHEEQNVELLNGLHEQAIAAGETGAAVCTDCHGAHDVQRVAAEPGLVAGICGDCHVVTLAEWRESPHLDIGPLGCATCHSPHSQQIRVGPTPSDLCMNCHEPLPESFVHQQHRTDAYTAQCTDCHMFVAVATPDPAETVNVSANVVLHSTGHTARVETLACNTCHEDFVDSGEWARTRGAEVDAASSGVPPETTTEADDQAPNYVQLLQGLILGIGFGITGAAIFITRGNQQG